MAKARRIAKLWKRFRTWLRAVVLREAWYRQSIQERFDW